MKYLTIISILLFSFSAQADKLTDIQGLWKGPNEQLLSISVTDDGYVNLYYSSNERSLHFDGELGFVYNLTNIYGKSDKSLTVEDNGRICKIVPEISLTGTVIEKKPMIYQIKMGTLHGKGKCNNGDEVYWELDISGQWKKY